MPKLWDIGYGRIGSGLKRLEDRGVTVEDWERMLSDDQVVGKVSEAIIACRPTEALLSFVAELSLSRATGQFVATDHFGQPLNGRTIHLWNSFKLWFLGRAEKPSPAGTLVYHDLLRDSLDPPIIVALGPKADIRCCLADIFALLAQQADGESGPLLVNGCANVFYVESDVVPEKDQPLAYANEDGELVVLRTVSVSWGGVDWGADAFPVEDPNRWGAGARVFSRKRLEPQTA